MSEPERTLVLPAESARRGWLTRAVAVVLVVLAVLLLLDRLGEAVAETIASRRLQTELATPSRPSVEIGGFPFVTQVVTGSFSSVHLVADDAQVPVSGRPDVAVAHADVTLAGIEATDRYATIVAGRAEGTFLLDYESLSELSGSAVEYAGDARIGVGFSLPLGLVTVTGTATGQPVVDVEDQVLTIEDAEMRITSGEDDEAVADAVGRLVLGPVPMSSLPYGLRLTGLEVNAEGVEAAATATDVLMRGGR